MTKKKDFDPSNSNISLLNDIYIQMWSFCFNGSEALFIDKLGKGSLWGQK